MAYFASSARTSALASVPFLERSGRRASTRCIHPTGRLIPTPEVNRVTVAQLNELLVPLGMARLEPEEWAPLAA